MRQPCLLIRADASPQIGAGHAMRCLALAQAWQDARGRVVFVAAEMIPSVERLLTAEQMKLVPIAAPAASNEDARATSRRAAEENADWMVVDGYRFDRGYVEALHESGRALLVLDDDGRSGNFSADLLLNQNAYATSTLYASEKFRTNRLLGARYTMLRREFFRRDPISPVSAPIARRVLVTLGAADPVNATEMITLALATLDDPRLEVAVVIGGANLHRANLESAIRTAGPRFRAVIDSADLSGWMEWADLAVTAAGSTCWELAFFRVPQLAVSIAENQRPVAKTLAASGAGIDLGWHEQLTATRIAAEVESLRSDLDRRTAMQSAALRLIDGLGAARVVAEMRSRLLRLRAIEPGDCRWVWELANEPAVRSASFHSDPIPWESHCAWFQRRLADSVSRFYVALDGADTVLGQVRFELEAGDAIISLSLCPTQRGRGSASAVILAGCRRLFAETQSLLIRAFIKPGNGASIGAFLRAGFRAGEDAVIAETRALQFLLHRRDLPEYADL